MKDFVDVVFRLDPKLNRLKKKPVIKRLIGIRIEYLIENIQIKFFDQIPRKIFSINLFNFFILHDLKNVVKKKNKIFKIYFDELIFEDLSFLNKSSNKTILHVGNLQDDDLLVFKKWNKQNK